MESSISSSILIVGKQGSGKTTYLNEILALLPEGSYCDGDKLVPITEALKIVFLEDVKCSFIDAILNNENQYKHIFTTSEKIDKVKAMQNKASVDVFDLDSHAGRKQLDNYLVTLSFRFSEDAW